LKSLGPRPPRPEAPFAWAVNRFRRKESFMRSLLFRTTGAMIFLVAVAMVVTASDKDEDQPGKGKGKGKGKSDIVQVDLSKLHPGIAQYVRENALVSGDVKGKDKGKKKDEPEKKGKGKGKGEAKYPEPEKKGKGKGKGEARTISLADAISIGERSGTVVKAERKGEGADATYRLDIRSRDGEKTKMTLDAYGRPTDSSKSDEKGKGKGKGKGKSGDED
jgi:uncharacterized membrane protein YkoI